MALNGPLIAAGARALETTLQLVHEIAHPCLVLNVGWIVGSNGRIDNVHGEAQIIGQRFSGLIWVV